MKVESFPSRSIKEFKSKPTETVAVFDQTGES